MKAKVALGLAFLVATASSFAADHGKHSMHHHGMGPEGDKRAPVPMTPQMSQHQLSNMREHLVAIQEIVAGMAKKNFKAMEAAAKKLGTSPEMTAMCEHMGKGAPGFTELGMAFHKSGDELAAAAGKKNMSLFLTKLDNTLQKCTACHAQFRQEIVPSEVLKGFQKSGLLKGEKGAPIMATVLEKSASQSP